MAAPARASAPLVIKPGQPWSYTATITIAGAVTDLSTWTFTGTLRTEPDVDPATACVVDDSGSSAGVVIFSLDAAATAALPTKGVFAAAADPGSGADTFHQRAFLLESPVVP